MKEERGIKDEVRKVNGNDYLPIKECNGIGDLNGNDMAVELKENDRAIDVKGTNK